MHARIIGTGSYLPEKILTNDDLSKLVDTSDVWITERTGIRERRMAAEGEMTSDLALVASQRAIQAAGVQASDIDLIVVATTTPDVIFPSTACILQQKLGIPGCAAFDVQAVCSGFLYALATADNFIRAGSSKCALIVGAEIFSRILDWTDRTTCVLFGDGAGAAVLRRDALPGVIATELHADGRYTDILKVPGSIAAGAVKGKPYLEMDGPAVFKFAVKALGDAAESILAAQRISKAEVDWMIPHQANLRIIESTAKRLDLPMSKVVVTLPQHGNTSAASIPLALDTAVRDGRVKQGDLLLLEGIGGGFAWGSALVRW
ncbi:3-oxoacyl-[acyl-carrier-protein] synthase-3 [Chitinivorax tropicus]|uniref:Beta-ketoacyl-[acyl-carrier-protein] synthase III n=1 Tax=Chitinivorax tropicus TaxID=714531 RepID=A0A840MEE0_9PROT|nr:beta-ketoacyl-ACP synthase III [Chitinivorax tropicus]MBB5017644.1 3-oxoacyl-[acyl-carrier-protein] synthase-3 [Chitinivorax tropicus]